jgi:hypothetical protein
MMLVKESLSTSQTKEEHEVEKTAEFRDECGDKD